MDNIPFSDTIFTRAGAAINRPLLLIEPPQRINGDDKEKLCTTPRSTDKQATKNTAASEPKPTTVTDDTVQKNTAASEPKPNTATEEAVVTSSEKQQQKKAWETYEPKAARETHLQVHRQIHPPSHSLKAARSLPWQEANKWRLLSLLQSRTRLPSPSAARPVFESNIVLGVALEGSRRTLPIEEGIPPPVEENKMAASRSGNRSSPSIVKDRKGQTPAGDQSEQER